MTEDDARAALACRFNVSRETLERLEIYDSLLRKWSLAINLVAASTLPVLWARHFLESAAVFEVAGLKSGVWLDLGSGGGFPGIVVAILAAESAPGISVTCIEADLRKCEFMRSVARSTGIKAGIISRRIEDAPRQNADVVSARALAPLGKLMALSERHLLPQGTCVFPKGASWRSEIDSALEHWRFTVEKHDSPTDENAAILKIGDIAHA